jgi:3-oxoadipate enol-lactonase/4-carboxymuconolactone decarboxylase
MSQLLYTQISGREDAPWLVLMHSLGATHRLWDVQMPAFEQQFRVLRLDLPGHGASPLPASIGLDAMADAVLETLESHGVDQAYFCGLSLGGVVAQAIALKHPGRVLGLVLANTGAKVGSAQVWGDRVEAVRSAGVASLIPALISRWFTPPFTQAHPGRVRAMAEILEGANPQGYIMACESLAQADLRQAIHAIKAPTLVIAGEEDLTTPVSDSEFLAATISGARLTILKAAHISNIEQPGEFARLVLEHCAPGQVRQAALREAGMLVRRLVLGDAYVDAKRRDAPADVLAFQDFITEAAWGQVWTRPGLSRRDRSLLVLALTLAGNREAEFVLHLRASKSNGVTRDEIREFILQAAVYAGVPAGNHAMTLAQKIWSEEDAAAGHAG